jgi:hypothetical protein
MYNGDRCGDKIMVKSKLEFRFKISELKCSFQTLNLLLGICYEINIRQTKKKIRKNFFQ